jgi:heme oxygenase
MSLLDAAATTTTPLSAAMRDGSRAQHDAAESSVFIEDLMSGRIKPVGYVNYLRSLRPVYEALEETGRAVADHPVAGALVDPALDRTAAIDADLAHWSTGDAEETLVPTDTADAYAAAIRATVDQPELFVAHHYTRYLGDLSGGQAIGRVLDRDFGLGGQGLALYHFEQIEKVKPYKDAYRERLDALDLTAEQRDAVVSEVQRSFSFNQAIFAELGQHLDTFRR